MKVALDAVARPEFNSVAGHEADDEEGDAL